MKKVGFISQLEQMAVLTKDTPVISKILNLTAAQLKQGDPSWWASIAAGWELRRFTVWNEAAVLYLTALHFEALSDARSPLASCYPSCGGGAGTDPSPGLAKFLEAPPPSFFKNILTRTPCDYWESLSALWIGPALLYFQSNRAMPFYLIDAEAGAGLSLAADALANEPSFRSELVAARIGLERHPLDLAKVEDRNWLTARIVDGSETPIRNLNAAIESLQEQSDETADFLQIVPCPPEKAPEFIAKNISADDPSVGLLLFNIFMTRRMSDADYAAYTASVAKTLEDWGDRGLWVEVENSREQANPAILQLRVHRMIDGKLRSLVMSQLEAGAPKSTYSPAAAAFLAIK